MVRIFRRATETLAHVLALLAFAGLLVLAIMVCADIVLRALFDHPLQGVNDVSAMVMAVVIAACIPKMLLLKQNISIEVLGQTLGGRWRKALDAFASVVMLGFFALMVWKFIPYAASVTASGERTWVLRWPIGPWWWVATGFLAVAVVAQLMVALSDLAALFGRDTDRSGGAGSDAIL
ncbi:MAG: TRAP transporter small permease [Rhodobacter sp.]|nr:TRAP transporter small permease [Paracoccaceae bacterium]MCC0076534.1 TRAP transporter small permease [Rhodobacter sp.]